MTASDDESFNSDDCRENSDDDRLSDEDVVPSVSMRQATSRRAASQTTSRCAGADSDAITSADDTDTNSQTDAAPQGNLPDAPSDESAAGNCQSRETNESAAGDGPSGGTNGAAEPRHTYTLDEIHGSLLALARMWEAQGDQGDDEGVSTIVKLGYEWLQSTKSFAEQDGTSSEYLQPLFPVPDQIPASRYEDGTILPIVEKSYPNDDFISAIAAAEPRDMGLAYHVLLGDIDADGTVSVTNETAGKTAGSLFVSLAKKSNLEDDPYKYFLRDAMGFSVYYKYADMVDGNIAASPLLPMAMNGSILKRHSWEAVCSLICSGAKSLANKRTDTQSHLRAFAASRTSVTNFTHGVLETEDHYISLFEGMMEEAGGEVEGKKAVLAYIAGFFSGDGCIRTDHIEIFQSNEPFLNAVGYFLHGICGVKLVQAMQVQVNRKVGGGTLHRYVLKYGRREDKLKLCKTVGIFDYGRRVQWLLVLLAMDIKLAPGHGHKEPLLGESALLELRFIEALLSYSKKILES